MVNRKLALAVLSLCSLSPFLVGQGCGIPAPGDGIDSGYGNPSTLYDGVLANSAAANFWPTATGRTINVSITSSNSKSNMALTLVANTPEGGQRMYFMATERLGAAVNVSFTSDFTLMHYLSIVDYGQAMMGGTMTWQEGQDARYTVKVVQQ